MPEHPLHKLHRASLLLTLALGAPMILAGLWAGAVASTVPFFVAILCAGTALTLHPGPSQARLARALTLLWPLALWPVLYDGAVQIVEHYPQRYIDAWLLAADQILLMGRTPDRWPLGGPVEEVANFFYASYYWMIPACALWIWWRRGEEHVVRYGLAFLATFAACALIWLVAPSGGYHPDGAPDGAPWGPFTALMRWIYDASPHYAAAFPSSHVAIAFAGAAMTVHCGGHWLLWAWAAGVAWSTVQGQYHYLVDTPPAVVLGIWAAGWAASTPGWAALPLVSTLRTAVPPRAPRQAGERQPGAGAKW